MGRRSASNEKEALRKFLRWGVAAILLIACARQGLLVFSASLNISLNDGVLLEAEDALPTTIVCNTTLALPIAKPQNISKEMHAVRLALPTKEVEIATAKETTTSSCTEYRAYPVPEHQSGLPFLADVFATRDRQYLFFIGINRGICSAEFMEQDGWMDGENRFMCAFPDKTMVISEFVAPTGKIFRNNYMFKCKIPEEFQHLVVPGQESTNLHVDLHALHNPEGPKTGMNKVRWFPSQKVTDTPKIDQVPVCHAGYADLDKPYELAAYTRVKSTYQTQVDKEGNSFERSTIHRIEEWIDWHQSQGFDHLIIYDNDPEPHGPVEKLTKPFVKSGLVHYRWYPLSDCKVVREGRKKGLVKRIGQAAGGLSSMHRLGPEGAHFFAHMDVDEFFVVYEEGVTVLDYVKKKLAPSGLDVLLWKPTVLEHCNSTVVESDAASPMETKQCLTKNHASDVKLIMKMATMLHFQVHFPLATRSWNKPRSREVPWVPGKGDGFLAHYRGEITAGEKENNKKDRLPYFDKFIADRRKRKGLPPLEVPETGVRTIDTKKTEEEGEEEEEQAEDSEGEEDQEEESEEVEEQEEGADAEEGEAEDDNEAVETEEQNKEADGEAEEENEIVETEEDNNNEDEEAEEDNEEIETEEENKEADSEAEEENEAVKTEEDNNREDASKGGGEATADEGTDGADASTTKRKTRRGRRKAKE